MTQLNTNFISISGKNIAYYDVGDRDAPVILMGHSFLWTKAMWLPQIEALSSQYRLIVPDLWGHGESDGLPQTPTSIQALSDYYWQLMQELSIPQFSIIGLSVGGMWSTQMALDHPDNIRALIIMGTYVGAEPAESQAAYMELIDQIREAGQFSEPLVEAVWPYFYSENLSKDSPLIPLLKNQLRDFPANKIKDMCNLGKAIFTRESNLENLTRLTMPFAIITGEDDIARVPSESEEMARVANCKHLYKIRNAGHISNLEKPEDVSKCLIDFLSK